MLLKLGLISQRFGVRTQKIDGLALAIQEMKNFLVANNQMEIIIKMSFFTFNNADMTFAEKKTYLKVTYC